MRRRGVHQPKRGTDAALVSWSGPRRCASQAGHTLRSVGPVQCGEAEWRCAEVRGVAPEGRRSPLHRRRSAAQPPRRAAPTEGFTVKYPKAAAPPGAAQRGAGRMPRFGGEMGRRKVWAPPGVGRTRPASRCTTVSRCSTVGEGAAPRLSAVGARRASRQSFCVRSAMSLPLLSCRSAYIGRGAGVCEQRNARHAHRIHTPTFPEICGTAVRCGGMPKIVRPALAVGRRGRASRSHSPCHSLTPAWLPIRCGFSPFWGSPIIHQPIRRGPPGPH